MKIDYIQHRGAKEKRQTVSNESDGTSLVVFEGEYALHIYAKSDDVFRQVLLHIGSVKSSY